MDDLFAYNEKSAKGHKVWKRRGKGHVINPRLIPTLVNVRGKDVAFLQPNFTYIGRTCGEWLQSKWANPFKMESDKSDKRKIVINKYKKWLKEQEQLLKDWEELVARKLGCWCAPKPCHGDILIKLVKENLSKFPPRGVIVIRAMNPYIGEENAIQH